MNELWRDPTTNQCYLIPEGAQLQTGSLELISSNKERKLVQQEAVQSYACSAAEANQHIQERVTQMLELAGQEVGQFVQLFAADLGSQLASGIDSLSQTFRTSEATQSAAEAPRAQDESTAGPANFDELFDEIGADTDGFGDNVVDLEFDDSSEEDSDFAGIFEELKDELAGPLKELQEVISSELVDLGRSLAQLGKELLDELSTEEGGDALQNVKDWLNSVSDGDGEDEFSSAEDSVDSLSPEDETLLEELMNQVEGDVDIIILDEDAEEESQENSPAPKPPPATAEMMSKAASEHELAKRVWDLELSDDDHEESDPEQSSGAQDAESIAVATAQSDSTDDSESSISWPSKAALKRQTKAQLLGFAALLGLDGLSMTDKKAVILDAIERLRP